MSSYCEHFIRHLDTARLTLVGIRCTRPGPGAQPPDPTEVHRPMLGFVRHGCGILKTSAGLHHATPADVMLFSPGVAYEVRHEGCESDRCAVCVGIEPELITEWLSEHGVNRLADAPFGRGIGQVLRSRRTDLLLYRVLAVMGNEGGSAVEELEELVIMLGASVLETVRAGPAPDRGSAAAVRRVQEILAVRYHEALTLDDLAAIAGCSKYHLCRMFSAQTGMTISHFRHRLRINRAMARIMEGDKSFSELSQALGFYSHSHFSTVFRRLTGMTPSGFRASLYGY